ncbi:CBS domain containing-hemolysin-like protein [Actinoplanes lutulentus]|uniref:CBS domain containing-hemolysin-like protein n=1 Tax=Actinoplanes lutulentus TaxID=1287878 RepID=A0A327ZQB8_9ACTN|nr:hemolysin family protein [Actinoplanes lutulentus]MBB2940747.1 CBS domain containing-hemolysin-like protein [Actinoplanes lutulentus]RAK43058.1 CBS domain containing-hemolysin-like protein [Actinoplanes lutulentus]
MLIFIGVLTIVLLTAATGYFVAQEFAYVAVDRERLKAMADEGDAAAERALKVTSRLSFVLSGAQVGITVTALLAGYVAEPFLGQGTADLLGATGIPESVSTSISMVFALTFATVVQMVLGELAPKNLAIAKPEALARSLSRSTLIYLTAVGPLIRVFDATANRLLRAIGIEPIEELPQGATSEDLDRIIAAAEQHGGLDARAAQLLDHGLDFRTLTAAEAMRPRVDVTTIHADEPASRVVELLDTGHSRFPVIGDDVDDVIGVVSIADVVTLEPSARATTPVRDLATEAVALPESARLPEVLDRLKAAHRQLAIVVDEYGGFAGIITLEDVAEELVGEIHDEDDLPEPVIEQDPDGSWTIPGRARVDEIAQATGVRLPDHDQYDTVSGLILSRLGHLPSALEQLDVELPPLVDEDGVPQPQGVATLTVLAVRRHVPDRIALSVIRAHQDREVNA